MAKVSHYFEGIYHLEEKKLTNGSLTLLKSFRTNPKSNKPTHFLLEVLPSGKRKYVSSLYPIDHSGSFHFEYGGVRYHYQEKSPSNVSIEVYV